MKPDDADHGAEVEPPNEPAKVEVRDVDQELNYEKGANLESDTLGDSEVEVPDQSEVIPPEE